MTRLVDTRYHRDDPNEECKCGVRFDVATGMFDGRTCPVHDFEDTREPIRDRDPGDEDPGLWPPLENRSAHLQMELLEAHARAERLEKVADEASRREGGLLHKIRTLERALAREASRTGRGQAR